VQGICIYPIIDMPDWHTSQFMRFGLWDVAAKGRTLRRRLYRPYADELLRSQRRLRKSGLLPEPPARRRAAA
jgi:hypothetical protein